MRIGAWVLTSASLGGLAEAQTPTAAESPSTPPLASAAVEVILVGQADSQPLAELVQATLGREGVAFRLSHAPALREAELLDRPDTAGTTTRIWIALVDRELARLYFANVRLGRYLMRDVPLRSGLDELGRERIAQVIETSTLALLSGEAAMSREQFARSLQTLEALSQPSTETDPAPPPAETPQRHRTVPSLGVAYQSYWSGPDLGLLHGPALRVGVRREIGRGAFLGTGVVAPSFPQAHEQGGVEVRIRTTSLRLLLGGDWPLRRAWSWSVAGGGGISLSHITPRAIREGWSEKPARTNVTPWLQAELGVSWKLSRLVLSTALSSQLSLVETHYDHVRETDEERLFTPWVWQPGGVVGLAWH